MLYDYIDYKEIKSLDIRLQIDPIDSFYSHLIEDFFNQVFF